MLYTFINIKYKPVSPVVRFSNGFLMELLTSVLNPLPEYNFFFTDVTVQLAEGSWNWDTG